MRPRRLCALCEKKIREKERICAECTETWKNDLTSDWLRSIIQEANYQHNLQLRDYGRVVSLEGIKNI